MNRRQFLQEGSLAAAGLVMPALAGAAVSASARKGPCNILKIVIDGQAAGLTSALGNTLSPVKTPAMERLAQRGTWFTRAYAECPGCCPSRTAFLTGVAAARSGVYFNSDAFRRASSWISQVDILPQHFKRHGYLSAGYGFIAHYSSPADDQKAYSPGHCKRFDQRGDVTHTEADLLKRIIPGTYIPSWSKGWAWGVLPDDWDRDDPAKLQQDTEQANRAIALLGQESTQPFFATCGFWRPHVTWTVPKRYFDLFPLDQIALPPGYRPDDLADVPACARWLATHRGEHETIVKDGQWKQHLQAYYASLAYIDEQIGRVLDALEKGPHRDNTIVIFTSDHGWHNGEKNHWSKFYLSELACQVPLSISVPGLPRQVCESPVSLLDLYPTLVALCGLPAPATHQLDGVDLSPLLRGRTKARGQPVVSTFGPGCHSVRDEHLRYTRYRNGAEELYDHGRDPHEWANLASEAQYADRKGAMARWLPAASVPEIEYTEGKPRKDANSWSDEAFL